MSAEQFKSPEREPIRFSTMADFQGRVDTPDIDSPDLAVWMEENNVSFDSGPIKIKIGNDLWLMETSRRDWATLSHVGN